MALAGGICGPLGTCSSLTVDLSILIIWTSLFLVLRVSGGCIHFYAILRKNICKQTSKFKVFYVPSVSAREGKLNILNFNGKEKQTV